ncbi:MAG TPA: cytochrome c3 family protein [Pyrinomonadaceae bacterium]|nr:cytochrome c3 family protein [Pyrinomonadaceae bacterium]
MTVLSMAICFASVSVSAQKHRRAPVKRPPAATVKGTDYSHFFHSTPKHKGACNTCHQIPTDNWKKVRDYPDVADYPGHSACVSCHRAQFFKSAKPVICSVCHSKVSPRDDARFAFRNPIEPRQFLIEFPHDKHQDVIAKMLRPGEPRFVYASFRVNADEKHFNNCEICHSPKTKAPAAPVNGWPDAFVPDAASFKSAPTTHASCFNCHWKAQQPVNDNCAGCHKLSDKLYIPNDTVTRLSMKFRHAREQHIAECTTCHINITKSATLSGLQPDVPISSCSECHNREGLRRDVGNELEALDKDRNFVCSYCHTSDVGHRDAPASHYFVAGREPLLRKDLK